MASFLIDAHDWPAEPRTFKVTNIFLHLLNGSLLCWLLLKLGGYRLSARHAGLAAVIGAGLWLIHPLFVSTTLYIIQRQAILAATFVLVGLLGYLHGRQKILEGKTLRGGIYAFWAISSCTALACLSKANGILLPLLALALEYTTLTRSTNPKINKSLRTVQIILLGIPSVGITLLILHYIPSDMQQHPPGRSWSYIERLLTQPRVLWEYLSLLYLPKSYTPGLFNDQIQHSTDLLTPWTTLPALISLLGLSAFGVIFKKRWPILSCGILFFLAAHILESSIVPLELYYEHRNYLPALLLFWPLAVWLTAESKYPLPRLLLIITIVAMLGFMTHSRSGLWGNSEEQAELWALINPGSPRAQAYAAQFEINKGYFQKAVDRLEQAASRFPDEPQISINLIVAQCGAGEVTENTIRKAAESLRHTLTGTELLFRWLAQGINIAANNKCKGLELNALEELLTAAGSNPDIMRSAGRRQDLLHLEGLIAVRRGNMERAAALFKSSLMKAPSAKVALSQAAVLAQYGNICSALQHLDFLETSASTEDKSGMSMRTIHNHILRREQFWDNEIRALRETLLSEKPDASTCGNNDRELQDQTL